MEKIEQKKSNYILLMSALVVGGLLTGLATSTINIALPYLMNHFNASLDTVKWAMTGFILATGIIAPVTCYFGEKFSYKRTYLVAIIGFTISSVFCALAWNVHVLIVFRILQGVFNGLALPSTMSIIYQVVPRKKQAFSMSLWSLSAMLAPAIGPTLSGWLIQNFNWQSIFIINIPIGIISIIFIIKTVPYYKLGSPKGFDLPGFLTCLVSSVLLLTAFSESEQWGWTSLKTVSFLVLGLIILVIFIFRELTADNPILNLNVFRYRGFTMSVIIRGVITMALYAGSLLTPLFLQNAQHISALDAGLVLLSPSLAMALCMIIVGKLYSRLDPRVLVFIGLVLMAIGSYFLSKLTLDSNHSYIVLFMTFRNTGIAFAIAPITMVGMSSLDKKVAGSGSSINNWVAQSIGCLSIGIFTSLLASRAKEHAMDFVKSGAILKMGKKLVVDKSFVMGINDVYLISVVIILVAIPLSFLLKADKPKEESIKKIENDEVTSVQVNASLVEEGI